MTVKERVCESLHRRSGGLTWSQRLISLAIVSAVILAIVGSEPELPPAIDGAIDDAEDWFGLFFMIEYVLRVWSAGAMPQYAGLRGRLRYMATPLALIDAIVLVPFILGAFGLESSVLRVMRVMRIVALAKMARYSAAMQLIVSSIYRRRFELYFAVTVVGLMILVTSAMLYVVEGPYQPRAFGSITRAMYWSVITLTSVGYGDVVPVTPLGKVCAGLTALTSIAMIAMPTAILAAAFADGFARTRQAELGASGKSEAR